MAESKIFNVRDFYPSDYCFDHEAFMADPDGYEFTPDDTAYLNAMELERYEHDVPMTYYERTLLRKWVMAGHSPRENPGSRYLCLTESEPYDFLDVHRMDREIRRNTRKMNKAERKAWLMEYMGWANDEDDPDGAAPEESAEGELEYPFR